MAKINKQVKLQIISYDWIGEWRPNFVSTSSPPTLLSSDKIIDFKPENDLNVFFSCIALLCLTGLAFRLLLKREEGDCSSEGELDTSSGIFIPFMGSWSVQCRFLCFIPRVVMLASFSFRLLKLLSIVFFSLSIIRLTDVRISDVSLF